MKQLTLNLPSTLNLSDQELRMSLASKLYEQGKLTSGEASKLAGVSKRTFLELLNAHQVSIFNFPEDQLEEDLKNA
ncbi:UPF0175 family protein [Marinoscillum furvescens]|uniref:Uncharacterized protein UPF0175 n=1 Tax=Marinoscillum furvescens DSM 4134 TaxID=1122208 RepID=A0A3D9KVN4_MARFU|nr:UPF0175 family protein [Marinoscillum furvescens]RED91634.1 uncharacterized protein UPF0175 [Marinoscillum furvescens DSM 4134]